MNVDYQLVINSEPDQKIREYMRTLGVSRIVAASLARQGVPIGSAKAILELDYDDIHHSLNIKRLEEAALLLKEYLYKPNSIIQIFGDYDTDGITSTALACKTFYKMKELLGLPIEDIWYYIPERKDGYGLSVPFAERFISEAKEHPEKEFLVLTVDNGITARPAVEMLKQQPNIQVLVTDHHQPDFEHGLTPTDLCICVDPHLEINSDGELLAGCGVIYNVLQKLEEVCGLDHSITDSLCYLAAIGTIGDMMQIDIYHACLIQSGLEQMNASPTVSWVEEVKRLTKIPHVTAKDIAFTFSPMINSCGQFGHAFWALEMLTETETDKVLPIVDRIHTLYLENKEETKLLKQQAEAELENKELPPFVLYPLRTDHSGLASKVATHLGKELGRPIILWAETKENAHEEIIAGSARNDTPIPAMQIVREAVSAGLLESAEGHKYAFGVKLYRSKLGMLQEFLSNKVVEYIQRNGELKPVVKTLSIDCIVNTNEVNVANMRDIERIPFAKNLEAPIVMIRGAQIKSVKVSKNNPKNVCYTVQSPGTARAIDIWAWNIKPDQYKQGLHTKVDLIGTIERNFMKPEYATLSVVDVRTY